MGIQKEESKAEEKKKQIMLKGEDKQLLKDSMKLKHESEKLLKILRLTNQLYIKAKESTRKEDLDIVAKVIELYSSR